MGDRRQCPGCHLPLQPDADVQGHDDEEHDECTHRLVGDLVAPGGAHLLEGLDRSQFGGEGVADLRSPGGVVDVGSDPDHVPVDDLDPGAVGAEPAEEAAGIGHRRIRGRHLVGGAPGEVDAEFEAAQSERPEAQEECDTRGQCGDAPPPGEVDHRLAGVQAPEHGDHGVLAFISGRTTAPDAGSPKRLGRWANQEVLASTRTIGPMKK